MVCIPSPSICFYYHSYRPVHRIAIAVFSFHLAGYVNCSNRHPNPLNLVQVYAYSSWTTKQCHRNRHSPEPVTERALHVRAPAHLCRRPPPGYRRRGNRPTPTCRFFGRHLGGPTTIIWSSRATDPHTGSGWDMFRDLRCPFYGMG